MSNLFNKTTVLCLRIPLLGEFEGKGGGGVSFKCVFCEMLGTISSPAIIFIVVLFPQAQMWQLLHAKAVGVEIYVSTSDRMSIIWLLLTYRMMVGCNSSPNSPGQVMDEPHPPAQSTPAVVTVQLRIATGDHDCKFMSKQQLPHVGEQPAQIFFSFFRWVL